MLILGMCIGFNVLANPAGGNIVSGQITIESSGNVTHINQSSKKAIINWKTFNIGKQEATNFQQPPGGIVLNRINSLQGISKIFGLLTATGKIILINPAGIYFGRGAHVNVAGIIATTADISNANFLSGNYQFNKVLPNAGSIINNGEIVTQDNGLAILVAPNVINNGIIKANLGHIILASGDAFTINFSGDNLINFQITAETSSAAVDSHGKKLKNGVTNNGSLFADGGTILITANAAKGILENAINMNGIVQANSVAEHNGEIILLSEGDGVVRVNGTLNATGAAQGGKIHVLGNKVLIDNNAVLNASGNKGGGEILIGGDFQGKNPQILNADYTYISKNATIYADALQHGNGGKIIVWSNLGTSFYGNIFARGGTDSGDGGFIEISGKDQLQFAGNVNANASHGKVGSLLLDPTNLFIINGANGSGDQDSNLSSGSGSLAFNSPDTTNNTISVGQLQALGDINITLQAKNQLTIGTSVGASAQVDLSNTLFTGTLNLIAGDATTVGGGNITFNSGSTITTGGGVLI